MMNKNIDIVFMGTPEFAVASLKNLIDNNYNVKAVVTAPDRPAGRGRKIQYSDVKTYALEQQIPILQPEKLKSEDFLNSLRKLNADLFIVVAFRMLPEQVWSMPRLGTFNLHASLLPNYRGAAPINHAIINGETKTGVTTFFINKNIDTGNIILQEECDILANENVGDLHDKLMNLGSELILKTVNQISLGKLKTISQENINLKNIHPAPKLNKEFCKINWDLSGEKIHNKIRGLSPYPAAWTMFSNDKSSICKIYSSKFIAENHNLKNGSLISDNKSFIKIAVSDGYIYIDNLQLAGKKRMNVKSLLNGYKFVDGIQLLS